MITLTPRSDSLLTYFRTVFLPKYETTWSKHTEHAYAGAVRKLCSFTKCDVPIHEVSTQMVDRFASWLITTGISAEHARKSAAYVLKIVKDARPDTPKQAALQPTKTPADRTDCGPDMPKSLWRFLHDVYAPHRLEITVRTTEQYGFACRSLERFHGRTLLVSELTDELILPWLLARSREVSKRSLKRERGDLLTLWRWATKHRDATGRRYCETPPIDIPTIKVPLRNPVAWRVEELRAMLASCRRLKGQMRKTGISKADWWSSFLLFLYWTGARLTAALSVRSSDVDLDGGWVRLDAESSKTNHEQILRLHEEAVAAISTHFNRGRELVWPYPYNSRQCWPQLKRILADAGLPADRYRMFHSFRRTNYTFCVKFGDRDIARDQLGHKSDLRAFYEDRTQIERSTAADVLPRLDGPHNRE